MSWNLACGLTERGHKVILYAPDNSQTPPKGFLYKTGPALNTVNVNWVEAEREDWMNVKHTLNELDIIMGDNWFGFEYASKAENQNLKICHRHHGGLNLEWWKRSQPPFKLNMIAISDWMVKVYDSQGFTARRCYNGVDMDSYPFKREKSNRLVFLGRIDPIKGPHMAIEVAEKAETPIDIVGGTSFVADKQYVSQTEIKCSQSKYATFIGEVSHEDKLKYLQNAKALVACSNFGEPFGLHFVEALASGTPVISTRDGAVDEIVTKDVGFISNTLDAMVKAVGEVDTISPEACRRQAEKLSKEVMAQRMESLYSKILAGDEW